MIQRIQSVYYLLIIISIILMMFIPLGQIIIDGDTILYTAIKGDAMDNVITIALFPLAIFLGVMAIYNGIIVFMFKNRLIQIKLAKLNGILLAVMIAITVLSADYIIGLFEVQKESVEIIYEIGTYLSFIPLLLNYLAIKRIKKDEELVRAADRLR